MHRPLKTDKETRGAHGKRNIVRTVAPGKEHQRHRTRHGKKVTRPTRQKKDRPCCVQNPVLRFDLKRARLAGYVQIISELALPGNERAEIIRSASRQVTQESAAATNLVADNATNSGAAQRTQGASTSEQ